MFALNVIFFWITSNTSLGKFGSKMIQGRLLIENLRYFNVPVLGGRDVIFSRLWFLRGFEQKNWASRYFTVEGHGSVLTGKSVELAKASQDGFPSHLKPKAETYTTYMGIVRVVQPKVAVFTPSPQEFFFGFTPHLRVQKSGWPGWTLIF